MQRRGHRVEVAYGKQHELMRQAFWAFAVAASLQKPCKNVFKLGVALLPRLQLPGSEAMLYFSKPLCQRNCRWVGGQPVQLPPDIDQLLPE